MVTGNKVYATISMHIQNEEVPRINTKTKNLIV
jgi:hypothetical protein